MSGSAPDLSVVVALISGRKDDLRRCLVALRDQEDPPRIEVLVPWDPPCRDVTDLGAEFPEVRFVEVEGLESAAARRGAGREHHDTLRTEGIRNAMGRYVALTEDHAVATPTWCADMVRLLDEHAGVAAIGGAVECGGSRLLHRAVYYCDFGRYQNPLPEGPAEFVSDSNVAYRREALESVGGGWTDDYHETIVHWGLREKGFELWLTPHSTVHQTRTGLRFFGALRERYVWGRSFAGTRVKGRSFFGRLPLAVLTPLLPAVFAFRLLRGVLGRKRGLGRFLLCLPHILLLQTLWAVGEFVGYVTGSPGRG